MKLRNKIVAVTGASRGIGRAIALACADEGAHVVLTARNNDLLQQTAEQIRASGGASTIIVGDMSVPANVLDFCDTTIKRFGAIDVLINNAGRQLPIGQLTANEPGEWIETISVNLVAPMLCCRAFLPAMVKRRGGKIINLSGGGATAPRPHFSAYASSKAAMVRLTETLAAEFRDFGIDINAVAPGAINTAMLEEVLNAGARAGDEELRRAYRQQAEGGAPLEGVTKLILFLSSSDSDGLTGKLISAVHDPWQTWSGRGKEISASAMYTLRRIDPFTVRESAANWKGEDS